MNRNRLRWTLRLILPLAAGIGLLGWALVGREPPTLVVENRSGQTIAVLRITVGGETRAYYDLANGSEAALQLQGSGEGTVRIEGRLADGQLARFLGRVDERRRLVVLPDGQITVPGRQGQGR